MFDLDGKVALITGGAKGQGAAEARLFSEHGARVMIADVREDEARVVAGQISNCDYVRLDVGDEAGWKAAVEKTLGRFGRLDVLVNNAAISHFSPIEETSLADFDRVMRINLGGIFLGMRTVLPALRAHGGSIINISSIAALTGRARLSAYASSKWAVRGLSRSAALEFAPHKIRVNSIIPGVIDTPMTREAYGSEKLQLRGEALPMGRVGLPQDIANLALFLASDESSFCTGGEYLCDGGETAGIA
ncbi:3-alpha-hydroxysteroid dehydrogenase [Burkholderia sp. SG-MS1]|uniref:SDR family NAD(P)-dependent oxidoreductase n=1 Tax=Paraburkholderia sp. SG-MS1 TaxID=2023741 RepID=UPI001446AB1E|nr:glucose 1-dehydrogenase [Paraburkholderia sp. SG-MS1]NKJ50696.1 3-alpha-hydroxysteroid dehydrogenase [Paraburkholderia sp. SG-MS1]